MIRNGLKHGLVAASIALAAGTAAAQLHSDIVVAVESGANALYTVDGGTLLPSQVFEGTLEEIPTQPGVTDDPGWLTDEMAPSALLGYDVTGALAYWDPNTGAFELVPDGEELDIYLTGASTPSTTVTKSSGPQVGPDFAQANASGAIHRHITFHVRHPDFTPSPFFNPITPGAYLLFLNLKSDAHDPSNEFVIHFNFALSVDEEALADERVESLMNCPADLDFSGTVDSTDLSILLSNFGLTPASFSDGDVSRDGGVDSTDLSLLLSQFGASCPS